MLKNNLNRIDPLVQEFEKYSSHYEENSSKLKDIIAELISNETTTGINLWKQLLQDNPGFIKTYGSSYLLCNSVFDEIKKVKGLDFALDLVKTDKFIRECLILFNGDYSYSLSDIFIYLADNKEYALLREWLFLAARNKYCYENFLEEVLISVLNRSGDIYTSYIKNKSIYYTSDLLTLLFQLGNQCLSKVPKAKFNIVFLYKLHEIGMESNSIGY